MLIWKKEEKCLLESTYLRIKIAHDPRRLSENREPTAENPFWPDFPIIIVKERNYSPQMIKKSDSKGLSLATASILGQSPSVRLFLEQKHRHQ